MTEIEELREEVRRLTRRLETSERRVRNAQGVQNVLRMSLAREASRRAVLEAQIEEMRYLDDHDRAWLQGKVLRQAKRLKELETKEQYKAAEEAGEV